MPKGTSPSDEELEFAYDCFARGLPDSEVIREWEDKEFPRRDKRTIGKYRRQYGVAKKVIMAREVAAADPLVIELRKKHFGQLTDVAQRLLEDVADDPEDVVYYGGPTCDAHYAVSKDGGVKVWLSAEGNTLTFDSLRKHLSNCTKLWKAFDEFKAKLTESVEEALGDPKKAANGPCPVRGPAGVTLGNHVLVAAPTGKDTLIQELNVVLLRGIVAGKCELCPGAELS